MVTGVTNSRLSELRKYTISGTIADIYITGGGVTVDGVNLIETSTNNIVYYLGGVKYLDATNSTGGTRTTFSYEAEGLDNANFITRYPYKDPNKENIIAYPKIDNDVFISRQEISAFEKNYKLEFIDNLIDLETYAGGSYFNVVKNC